MSDKANKSLSITPPISGQNTIVLATVTTAARVQLPSDWQCHVSVQADGLDVYVAFGDENVTVDETATSTVTSEAVTAHGTGECVKVPDGTTLRVNLAEVRRAPNALLYIAHKASAMTGYLRLVHSSGAAVL